MSLLEFHMLAYEFLKLRQELLIIIFIINVIIGTRHGAIIFFSQVTYENLCLYFTTITWLTCRPLNKSLQLH
jgi:hypothetical protein